MQTIVMMVIGLPLSLGVTAISPNLWVWVGGIFASLALACAVASKVAPERW